MKKHDGTHKSLYIRISPAEGIMKSVYPNSCKQMYFSHPKQAPAKSIAEMGAIFGESVSHHSSLNDRLKEELQQHPCERGASEILRRGGRAGASEHSVSQADCNRQWHWHAGVCWKTTRGSERTGKLSTFASAWNNDILMIQQKKK